MPDNNARYTNKRATIRLWVLPTLGVLLCVSFLIVGISIGASGALPESIISVLTSPTHKA